MMKTKTGKYSIIDFQDNIKESITVNNIIIGKSFLEQKPYPTSMAVYCQDEKLESKPLIIFNCNQKIYIPFFYAHYKGFSAGINFYGFGEKNLENFNVQILEYSEDEEDLIREIEDYKVFENREDAFYYAYNRLIELGKEKDGITK